MPAVKKSKNQLRREKLKLKKQESTTEPAKEASDIKKPSLPSKQNPKSNTTSIDAGVSINENAESKTGKLFESEVDTLLERPEFAQFKHVFDKFHMEEAPEEVSTKGDIMDSDEDEKEYGAQSDEEEGQQKISKKKLRKANKMPLAELKARSKYPELVQWYDVDATDPILVTQIKCQKNIVPVPSHWQFKREYLSGRRAIEKKPFELPKYIKDTGIQDMRDTTKDDDSNLKQRMREKVQPKMNRLDLDYQKLHDAFFKFQTRPRLFKVGDVYFEGRESEETDVSKYKPGVISDELRNALGVPKGMVLPWVMKMQNFGPPPSYPDLKIPGYNVDISEEENLFVEDENLVNVDNVELEPFGQLLSYEESEEEESEEEESEEEEEDEVEKEDEDEEEVATYLSDSEIQQAAGVDDTEVQQDVVPAYDAEENSDEEDVPLAEVDVSQTQAEETERKKLYQVLKESEQTDSGFMSSKRVYDLSDVNKKDSTESQTPVKKQKTEHKPAAINNEEDDDEEDDEEAEKFRF